MKKRTPDAVNLTPMIDIVFQMIIFFVFTIDLEREKFDKEIRAPDAKNAREIKEFEPATIYPQILASGAVRIGSAAVDHATFRNLIRQAVKRYGQEIPVMVYAHENARHRDVRRVMDICSEERLYRISLIGIIERSNQ
jgi:biopolymer transport protein ExbD